MRDPVRGKSAHLWQPSLQRTARALRKGLSENYESVSVAVTKCPDLREWGCATEGISGRTRILDVGGEAYAHNKRYRDKHFDIAAMAESCGLPDGSIFGAGMACPAVLDGHCGEMIASIGLPGNIHSKVARVGQGKACIVEDYGALIHSGLSNLYLSEGSPGPVIELKISKRIGDEASLTQAMRKSLIDNLNTGGSRQIALGGVFRIAGGRVRSHVMPDYDRIGFEYFDEERNEAFRDFLQFYEMGPNLLCFSVLWTGDPTGNGLRLRASGEHTHFYAVDGKQEAGHYHGDVTPDEFACTGYFHPAERVFRINDPES